MVDRGLKVTSWTSADDSSCHVLTHTHMYAMFCRVMQASSWKEQELLDERILDLEASKQELATELAAARAEVVTAQRSLAGQEAALRTLQEQLAKEKTALAAAKGQLQKEQVTVRSLRAKASSKVG